MCIIPNKKIKNPITVKMMLFCVVMEGIAHANTINKTPNRKMEIAIAY